MRSIYIRIRDGVVGNISACHADARGSIPRRGVIYTRFDTLAEWLRRQPAKLLGSTRAGSNPAGVVRSYIRTYIPLCVVVIYTLLWRNG